MHRRRHLSVLLAAVLAAGGLAAQPAGADTGAPVTAAPQAAPDTATIAISGTLLDADGAAVRAGQVSLSALVTEGRWTTAVPVADDVTSGTGRFDLVTDRASLPAGAVRGKAASLELTYTAAPGEKGLVYEVTATRSGSTGSWQLELPGDAVTRTNSAAATGFDLSFQVGTGLVTSGSTVGRHAHTLAAAATRTGPVDAGSVDVGAVLKAPKGARPRMRERTRVVDARPPVPKGVRLVPASANTRAATTTGGPNQSSATSCPPDMPASGWTGLQVFKWNYAPAKLMITKNRGNLGFVIGRSHETKLQVTMDVGGDKYAGGFTGAIDNKSEMTAEPTVGKGQKKLWKLKWRYQKFQKWCMPASGTWIQFLDVYKWRPKNPTGGNRKDSTTLGVKCGGKGPKYNDFFGAKTTISKDTTVTFNGFFTIALVRLDARQQDKSQQRFWIKPAGSANVKACGNNDAPLFADLAREVKY